MKYVLISLAESSKLDFSGADKLAKSDRLIVLYVKGKKTLPAKAKESFAEIVADIEYYEVGAASELWLNMAFLIGFHSASKHDVYVVTEDKDKIPSKIAKEAKIYASFRSIAGASASTSTSKSSSKKTTGAAKKISTSSGKTASKSSTAKKSTSSKKTTTKKTTTKKTASKKDSGLDVADLLTKSLTSMAEQFLKKKK